MNMKLRKQIADRLRAAMKKSHTLKTQAALQHKSGVGQATIGRILRCEGDTRIETLYDLAKALDVSVSFFTGELANVSLAANQETFRKAPIISSVQAGAWREAADIELSDDSDHWMSVPPNTGDNAFWLRVDGDSMTASAGQSVPEGSLILVDPCVPAENGRLVVAKIFGTEEATFKKLIIDGGRKYLKPLNPAYPLIEMTPECYIVGAVVEAKQRF